MTTSRKRQLSEKPNSVSLKNQHHFHPYAEQIPHWRTENAIQPSSTTVESHMLISHGCMIIPVAFGIWWLYFRRKANDVFQKILVKNDAEVDREQHTPHPSMGGYEKEDTFTTWEEVSNQTMQDPSLRFVRWIKRRGTSTTGERAQVNQTTKHTMTMASVSRAKKMTNPMIDTLLENESDDSIADVETPHSTQWQCLHEVGVDGIELCSMGSPTESNDDGPVGRNSVGNHSVV